MTSVVGVGKSKKLAKRDAAFKMLKALKQGECVPPPPARNASGDDSLDEDEEEEDEVRTRSRRRRRLVVFSKRHVENNILTNI